jgi:hypothetical protein
MKIYQIAGKQYAVIGEELFELSRASEWDGLQVFLTTPTQPEAPVRRKYGSGKLKKRSKVGGGKTHCNLCDGYGHFAKTCPNRDGTLAPDVEPAKREITKEMVDELRAAHPTWDTLKIAAELKCRLAEVNKYW